MSCSSVILDISVFDPLILPVALPEAFTFWNDFEVVGRDPSSRPCAEKHVVDGGSIRLSIITSFEGDTALGVSKHLALDRLQVGDTMVAWQISWQFFWGEAKLYLERFVHVSHSSFFGENFSNSSCELPRSIGQAREALHEQRMQRLRMYSYGVADYAMEEAVKIASLSSKSCAAMVHQVMRQTSFTCSPAVSEKIRHLTDSIPILGRMLMFAFLFPEHSWGNEFLQGFFFQIASSSAKNNLVLAFFIYM